MNTPSQPIDPLDPDELELARIVRALPGGDPPAALDARILRAAHDALAQTPRRRALWAGGSSGALWGIGSAAAAILAVGIGWKLAIPPDSNLPVPRVLPTAADSAEQDSTPVEFVPMPQRTMENEGPPPPLARQEAPRSPVAAPQPSTVVPAPAAPKEIPAPFADAAPGKLAENSALAGSRAEAGSAAPAAAATSAPAPATSMEELQDARSAYSERRRDEVMKQAAPATAPAPEAAKASADQAAVGYDREQSAGILGAADADADAAADADARNRVLADRDLGITAWIGRIRARRDAGDRVGAHASLKLFVERHPHYAIPTDLRPLLGE
ncbi:MAG: hypothetical protein ACREO3_10690 [Arenimonas sp.]